MSLNLDAALQAAMFAALAGQVRRRARGRPVAGCSRSCLLGFAAPGGACAARFAARFASRARGTSGPRETRGSCFSPLLAACACCEGALRGPTLTSAAHRRVRRCSTASPTPRWRRARTPFASTAMTKSSPQRLRALQPSCSGLASGGARLPAGSGQEPTAQRCSAVWWPIVPARPSGAGASVLRPTTRATGPLKRTCLSA